MRSFVLASLVVLLSGCGSTPPERVASRPQPMPRVEAAPRESFVPREPRLMPAETLIRSYTAIFGDLMIPEHRVNYDVGNKKSRYFGWEQHLSALGLPDYTRDHPRTTQTNTIMVAAFEKIGVDLCDRAATRDLHPSKPKPPTPEQRELIQFEAPPVFAFEPKRAPLAESDFVPRFDVVHRTFLGYPAALAPPERTREFYSLYHGVEQRHLQAKKGTLPDVAAWSAVCQALVRHPEFHHY